MKGKNIRNISKALTWEQLADIYDKTTGNRARIIEMGTIFDWAKKQTRQFFVDSVEGTIHIKEKRGK